MANKYKKILLINDIYNNFIAFKALISQVFPTVKFINASSWQEGLAACQHEMPDMIMFDLSPEGTGINAYKALKSDMFLSHIPVITISDDGSYPQFDIKFTENPEDTIIARPVNKSELMAGIKKIPEFFDVEEDNQNIKPGSIVFVCLTIEGKGNGVEHQKSRRKEFQSTLTEVGIRIGAQKDERIIKPGISRISNQRKASLKSYNSEDMNLALVESFSDGIVMSDTGGKMIAINRSAYQIFGYQDEAELKSVHDNFLEFIVPSDVAGAKEYLSLLLSGEEASGQEYLAINKNGEEFPIEIKSSVVSDYQSIPYALISVIRDITRRKKIEDTEQFLLSAGRTNLGEDFFQSLSKFLADSLGLHYICISRINADKRLAQTLADYCDGGLQENIIYAFKGNASKETVGKSACVFEGDVIEMFHQDVVYQKYEPKCFVGATLLSSDGKLIGSIALISRRPLYNRSLVESVLNLVSIRAASEMERQETEFELLQSRKAFQNYFQNCSVGMSVTSPEKKWLEVNQSLCQMLGYSKEELVKLTWVDVTYPDDVGKNNQLFTEMTEGTLDRYDIDKRFVRKDGSLLYATLSCVCERNPDGSVRHILSSYVDETARQLAEDAIRHERSLLRTLIDNLPDSIYIKDSQGRKIVANKAELDHLGCASESDIIGKTDKEIIPDEVGIRGFQEDLAVIQTGIPLFNEETSYFDLTGKQHWRLSSKIPFYDGNRKAQGLVGIGYDITERKLIEEALKASEELYRTLVEKLPDGVYKSTYDGKFVSVNNALVTMLGYNSKEELMAVDFRKELYFAPEISRSKVSKEAKSGFDVYKFSRKDGSKIWVEDHRWYNTDEKGNILYHEGIMRNVTERKRVEDELRILSRAVDQNPASIVITDTLGHIEYVNPKFTELTGYQLNEVLGKNPRILKSGLTSNAEYAELWKTILEGGEWQGEFKNTKKSGEEYFEAALISPIKNEEGQITHFLAVKEDITGQKNHEILIRKLSKAIEQSPVSTIITNAAGKIEFVNTAFTVLTQYTPEEVINKSPRIFNRGHSSDADFDSMWEYLIAGKVWKGEFQNRRKDKSTYWEDVTISSLMNGNGLISNFILIMDDISEKKKMLDDLISAKERAEESNRLKSAFLAMMNHELRTPLSHILGFSELIMSSVAPDENINFASSIQTSGQSLLSIIEGVFDMALVEQANIKLRKQTFSLMDHFMENKASLNSILRTSAGHEQIQLIFRPDTRSLSSYVTADRSKINQILTNLFKNAVKFTHKGIIEFGYIIENESNLMYYVKDTGIGIPPEKQSIIFDFFRQGDDSFTRGYDGIGIGLSVSKKISKILQGELKVVSEPEKGSTFSLTIPIELSDIKE